MIVDGYEPKKVKPISLDELEKYLWGAAVLLRGQIDATSYKEYIFPLVFFKRICDVYDEAYKDAMILSDGDAEFARADADQRVAIVPLGAHWDDVREVTENIGQALVTALTRIEQANPAQEFYGHKVGGLSGIFGPKQIWTNKDNMPDRLIADLLEHFSQLKLSLAACPADEMGTGYEYLVGKFADDAGHTAQEFYTNRTVVDLMAEILQPKAGESIYDPTCGSGGMLIKCLTYVRDKGQERHGMRVYGQELNSLTASIARMNLFLHGVEDYSIVNDDTLTSPGFIQNGHLQQFDIVLANPPYSIKQWNRDAFASDKWGRNFLGVPPQGRADYAFFQHILASMKNDTGRCAILFPHGVLFREEEKDMREKLVSLDLIDCIIGIGKNLFYNSAMAACIIICRKNKPWLRKGKILFIDAIDYVTTVNNESTIEPEQIEKIVSIYNSFETIDKRSAVVEIDAVKKNNNLLSVNLYVSKVEESAGIDVDSILSDFADSAEFVHQEMHRLFSIIGLSHES